MAHPGSSRVGAKSGERSSSTVATAAPATSLDSEDREGIGKYVYRE